MLILAPDLFWLVTDVHTKINVVPHIGASMFVLMLLGVEVVDVHQ